MSKKATATFEMKGWDEKPYDEVDGGPKLTRVSVTKSYDGDIEGEGTLEYLMMHREDGSASFIGLERVVGKLDGRSGSFVLQHEGTFEDGIAKAKYFVLSDSGTGDLQGLQGQGDFEAGHQERYPFTLEYTLD